MVVPAPDGALNPLVLAAARLADRFSNPVPDGTAVSFQAVAQGSARCQPTDRLAQVGSRRLCRAVGPVDGAHSQLLSTASGSLLDLSRRSCLTTLSYGDFAIASMERRASPMVADSMARKGSPIEAADD